MKLRGTVDLAARIVDAGGVVARIAEELADLAGETCLGRAELAAAERCSATSQRLRAMRVELYALAGDLIAGDVKGGG